MGDDRQIGEQLGELRAEIRGVGKAVEEMRAVNSREHAANGTRQDRMERKLSEALKDKADAADVKALQKWRRSIEDGRTERRAYLRLANLAKGAFIALTPFGVFLLMKVVE